MKKENIRFRLILTAVLLLLALVTAAPAAAADVAINTANFPDDNFREYVEESCDTDGDGWLTSDEIDAVTKIRVSASDISDLKGIEYFTALKELWCGSNRLASLDLSGNTALEELYCYGNELTSLDLSKNTALTDFNCSENQLTSLDVSRNTALTYIGCEDNQLTSLDVRSNTELTELRCYSNKLKKLDISKSKKLAILRCNYNQLSSLDISGCPGLKKMVATTEPEEWESDSNVKIWFIADKDSPGFNAYELRVDKATQVIMGSDPDAIAISTANFPDDRFREYVKETFDTDGDGGLSSDEIDEATEIRCSASDISDLKGIEYFTALRELWCGSNYLTSLDLSNNTALKALYCYGNELTSLDVSKNTALTDFNCGENRLKSLDVSKNTALTYIGCENNLLTSLDVGSNTELTELRCYSNKLKKLDISKNKKLAILRCNYNSFSSLDVSGCLPLKKLVNTTDPEAWESDPEVKIWRIEDEDYPGISDYELRVDKATQVIAGKRIDLKNSKISKIAAQVYTGKAIRPELKVTCKGKELVQGTDYTVAYQNNKNVGTATVTVTGKGNYTGKKKATFVINPKPAQLNTLTAGKKQLTLKWGKINGVDGYQIEYSLKKDFSDSKKKTISKAATTRIVLKKLKTGKIYYVRIRTWKKVDGKKYYSAWSAAKKREVQ